MPWGDSKKSTICKPPATAGDWQVQHQATNVAAPVSKPPKQQWTGDTWTCIISIFLSNIHKKWQNMPCSYRSVDRLLISISFSKASLCTHRWIYCRICNAQLVRCQTHSYLPNCKALQLQAPHWLVLISYPVLAGYMPSNSSPSQ